MHFSTIAAVLLAAIPSILADQRNWELVVGRCNTGLGPNGSYNWDVVRLAGTGGCSGCNLDRTGAFWKSPNPCKRCNSGDKFDYIRNGSGLNVYAEGNHNRIIAHCYGTNGPNMHCNVPSASCVGPIVYKCSGDLHCD